MNTEITSADHVSTIKSAIENLVKEYAHLHGRMTMTARSRRIRAMEQVTAATFAIVTEDLDPCNEDNLSDQLAEETLQCSLFSTDHLVSVLLDIDGAMRSQGPLADDHEDWAVGFLLETWLMFLEQLKATGDGEGPAEPVEATPDDEEEDGDDMEDPGQLAA